MTQKILMVDVDGVIVHPVHQGGWAAQIEADLGITRADLQANLFVPHWPSIIHGRADLQGVLDDVLHQIAPHLNARVLMDYWFRNDGRLDEALLEDLATLRSQGVALHLATVQEHHRAGYLWNTLGLNARFDAMHYAADLGAAKPDLAFFRAIEARTGRLSQDHFLLDDRQDNVDGALAAGWSAALWDGSRPLAEVFVP
ncbi:MAG: haloacid dehalogenase [Alphaproteobacteria bacterium PA2]|nr:MAG: haloacid dehalogenase [Alphaproteobacteria bacterium PA2]